MKKIIELIKKILGLAKTVTPEQKKEAEAIVTNVVAALDEVKAKRKLGVHPAALAPIVSETPAAPKKKKKYYPAQPKKAK